MIELVRTDDPVFLGWLRTRLAAAGVHAEVFDAHTSSLYGGALDAITARVMVDDADIARARLILAEADRLDSGTGCEASDASDASDANDD
ncbi:MAG: DUF2007 domain-containing protein [Rhodospirillales bacterium]|nr:MAG: DUF2007 domain-containing protein [Rhodospirillales bacterium]